MQVFTTSQTAQIKLTLSAMGEALEIIDYSVCNTIDRALVLATSERAIAGYKLTGKAIYHSVMLVAAAAFYMGVGTRELWNRFTAWADAFVAECEAYQSVEISEYSVQEEAIAASDPVEVDVWEEPIEVIQPPVMTSVPVAVAPTLLLPPAKVEPAVEVPVVGKKRRGRPKKAA